jgi:Domain of unknown function (DUF1996)
MVVLYVTGGVNARRTRSRKGEQMMRVGVFLGLAVLTFLATAAIPGLVRSADALAEFSVLCTPTHQQADDPIVFPGQPGAAHMHQFIGNPSANAFSTFETMRQANPACELSSDTGGYWVPTLHKPDGSLVSVKHTFFYYRGPKGVAQIPFSAGPPPQGLKMIAGGDTRNPPRPNMSQKSLSWACTDSGPYLTQPPDCTSLNKSFRAHIHFPSCWNGWQLDSSNHRSHMTYPASGRCPSTHPVRIPKISYHVVYNLQNGKGTYLSSDHEVPGAPPATQLHADFWNTWDQVVLQKAVTRCINADRSCKRLITGDRRLQ